ncbi:3-hydroxyalkanoate synthetase [Lampropedia cohaerens]|uniref:3-hydroxyalkanoate synthetase n=1 Tax=Lampropedia cohaerens TaxID=1610491 RepID=A0A0U1Q0D9_9BURK|nr:DUF3141 domain-containing protein [Lampropedia cohaerens]KKW68229.1 3-hydroxyalkanoate synthetase [Lampropedia cohaerens]
MTRPRTPPASETPATPLQWTAAATDYLIDAWQRSVLYADIRRQRGNQYRAHLQEKVPNVLQFEAELVMSGQDLPHPVNYGLVRIIPGDDVKIDPTKRPFIVVDPRAGHGPGIGGFKPDSEIGAALKAGHPCYFVGFLPDPVPGQTVEDVMRAEAEFVRKVAQLHPDSLGKPAVIGNCQAGWQVLMTAAVWPELFGPIILAGAPLSYWAGKNPMRYAGGLLGGSWLTAMTSDLGAGRFDGAWLVQNFENLDPANTLWTKQYNLYAKVDTEGPRYLGFEKYWGGHVFLDGGEMQYIVDNLFIGNKLATAELVTSDGVRIDLRNVRSPIVVFCSYGDNITPPPQALGWITDLYRNDADVAGHDQTIVFATHDSIGHLGIFVSGSVGRREHREFAANIDLIDLLPAGIYRAEVEDREGNPADDPYLLKIRRSGVDEIRAIVQPDPASERRFAAAARVSEINLALYRNFAQPWVRALSTPLSARWLQALHPLRIGYEWWSDLHPLAPAVADLAEQVRAQRQAVDEENPFWQLQQRAATAIEYMLDRYRDHRDAIYALTFDTLYGSPALQALAGQSIHDQNPPRQHPGDTPEHRAYIASEQARLQAELVQGGLAEALVRGLIHVLEARGETDERIFHCTWQLARPHLEQAGNAGAIMAAFRALIRRQARLVQHAPDAAIAAIAQLVVDIPEQTRQDAAEFLDTLVRQTGAPSPQEARRLKHVLALLQPTPGRSRGRRPNKARD